MGLREKMNENPAITTIVTLVIIVLAVWFMWTKAFHRREAPPTPTPVPVQPATPPGGA